MKAINLSIWRYQIKTTQALKRASDVELDILGKLLAKEIQRRTKK